VEVVYIILIVGSAIVFHEFAHGWVAYRCGDPTAKMAGRLTLNPIKHVDVFGSLILPGVLIVLRNLGVPVIPVGWAKPVPVNFLRLRNPKRDMILVGMAGPIVNVIMAVVFGLLLRLELSADQAQLIGLAIFLNLLLAIFNMIPIPPLDGSRLVMGLLPNQLAGQYARLERYGILIIFLLLPLGLFHKVVLPVTFYCAKLFGVEVL